MGQPERGFQPWSYENKGCNIDECREHLLAYRKVYESRSTRSVSVWVLLALAGLALLFTDAYRLGLGLLVLAVFVWLDSRRHAQMADLIGVLWGLALLVNRDASTRLGATTANPD
jgi:hypothetical protein